MGLLLLFNGAAMIFSAIVSAIYKDGATQGITFAALLTLGIGGLVMFLTKNHQKEVKKREGYLIVTMGWLIVTVSGTMPYLVTGAIPSVTNIFFETISGYTTTGASILNDVESLPKGLLFWRSTTHWLGGMGIIVLAIAILPLLGIGGMQLFSAEAPGISGDKIHPRISDTAKRLWFIYVGYTVAETLLLSVAGMSLFDAINHAMSTVSTGGFSTKNDSLTFWNDVPAIQYIIILFMFLGGANFVLSYFAFKGRIQKVLRDEEFKWYATFLGIFLLIVVGVLWSNRSIVQSQQFPQVWGAYESAFRHGLFQIVAVVTTTGFVSADFTQWTPFLTLFFFSLMFLGGSAGSTSGGVKVIRHLIMIKNGFLEFKRSLHPNAIIPVRYNGKTIDRLVVYNVLAFFIFYLISFIVGAGVLSAMGLDFESAIGASASSLGNLGPALGDFGPSNTYASMPVLGKWWCSFLMLLGRLELFTVLMLLTPFFWRKR